MMPRDATQRWKTTPWRFVGRPNATSRPRLNFSILEYSTALRLQHGLHQSWLFPAAVPYTDQALTTTILCSCGVALRRVHRERRECMKPVYTVYSTFRGAASLGYEPLPPVSATLANDQIHCDCRMCITISDRSPLRSIHRYGTTHVFPIRGSPKCRSWASMAFFVAHERLLWGTCSPFGRA